MLSLQILGGKNLNTTKYLTASTDYGTSYDAKALGCTIRLLREGLQLTQADLGNLSSFSPAEI